jgi:hypothetical protein
VDLRSQVSRGARVKREGHFLFRSIETTENRTSNLRWRCPSSRGEFAQATPIPIFCSYNDCQRGVGLSCRHLGTHLAYPLYIRLFLVFGLDWSSEVR